MSRQTRRYRRPYYHVGFCTTTGCSASIFIQRGEEVAVTSFRTTPHLDYLLIECAKCHKLTYLFTGLLVDINGYIIADGLTFLRERSTVILKTFERASKAVAMEFERSVGYPAPMPVATMSINKEVASFAAYIEPIPNISSII